MDTSTNLSGQLFYVGADISKSKIDIYYELSAKSYHKIVNNEFRDIENYLTALLVSTQGQGLKIQVIMEATGTYGERLAYTLHEMGIRFSLISPSKSRAFMQSENASTINDKECAKLLRKYGIQKQPEAYQMPDALSIELKQMISALDKLKEDLQRLNNQIHADSYRAKPAQIVSQIWEQRQSQLKEHIQQLEDQIQTLTQDHFKTMIDNLCSIKGIGKLTATAFVILTQGFVHFDSAKQLVKFIGLCPTENSSGSSVRKGKHIPKKGISTLKSLLFNAARSALRSDNVFKQFYDRLKCNGKNGKVALTAVMRKMATYIFAIAKTQHNFDLNFNKN